MNSISNTNHNVEMIQFLRNSEQAWQARLELVDWCLYSTKLVYNYQTEDLRFYMDVDYASVCQTNVQMPGMLPNPCAMEVRELKVFGIASDMMFSVVELVIGNKLWVKQPAWICSGVYRWTMQHPLFIPPLCPFRGSIRWDGAIKLGQGFSGHQLESKPIQMCLIGSLARSVQ